MPVPSSITDLSTTAGSNSPSGSESPITADDYLRTISAFVATLRDGKGQSAEATVASASTADIGAASSPFVQITGTTGITSFGTTYSGARYVRFAGALTLTHNATTLILPGGANITTAAGDTLVAVPTGNPGAGWRVVVYQRADGTALVSSAYMTKAANLSDVASAATARANLGLVIGTDVLAPNGDGSGLTGIKKIAQWVVLESTALGSTTAVISMDDSIPQNTEGDLWLSQSFTPVNPASTIYVRVFVPVFLSNSVASLSVIALFSSESTDAKAVAKMYNGSANPYDGVLTLGKTLTSWSGARTFTVRVGVGTGGALMYLNGRPTPLALGRVENSYLEIIEVLP